MDHITQEVTEEHIEVEAKMTKAIKFEPEVKEELIVAEKEELTVAEKEALTVAEREEPTVEEKELKEEPIEAETEVLEEIEATVVENGDVAAKEALEVAEEEEEDTLTSQENTSKIFNTDPMVTSLTMEISAANKNHLPSKN